MPKTHHEAHNAYTYLPTYPGNVFEISMKLRPFTSREKDIYMLRACKRVALSRGRGNRGKKVVASYNVEESEKEGRKV